MSIIDGRFLAEPAKAPLAAGRQAPVPLMVGANDRDLPLGEPADKAALFASFGTETDTARRLYDPLGNQTLAELKQQVFADRMMVEPARHLAKLVATSGSPLWLYRFGYVLGSQRGQHPGVLHGLEIRSC
ncbi:MAG: hypothetical protein MUF08_09880 [Burkholderiaceae bacterium]|nr:hypothetical protein [Burkholderiaceae bacterium]